ncbi:MAG: hypothetical protein NW206_05950 [Hyphomonadaceae bacterium]|nr:hypothetical protein [Hyphomonadaceae bacterium]
MHEAEQVPGLRGVGIERSGARSGSFCVGDPANGNEALSELGGIERIAEIARRGMRGEGGGVTPFTALRLDSGGEEGEAPVIGRFFDLRDAERERRFMLTGTGQALGFAQGGV